MTTALFRSIPVLFLLLFGSLLHAQHPDIRLSVEEETTTPLDYRIRLQAAASVGTTTMVVAGTYDAGPGDTLIPTLNMQLLRGTVPSGVARRLLDSAARPTTALYLLPLRERFALIWFDSRPDDFGLHLQILDTNGLAIGAPELLSHGAIFNSLPREIAAGSPDEGYLLYWEDSPSNGGWTIRHLTPEGVLGESARRLRDGSFRTVGSYLFFLNTDGVHLVRKDATLDPRAITAVTFPGLQHIGTDSAIALLATGELAIYRTLFDTLPLRRIPLPLPPVPAALVRGSDGHYRVYYGQYSEGDDFIARLFVIEVPPEGPALAPQIADSFALPSAAYMVKEVDQLQFFLCRGNFLLGAYYQYSIDYPEGTQRQEGAIYFTIYEDGSIDRTQTMPAIGCQPNGVLPVWRDRDESRVTVVLQGDTMTLAMPAVVRRFNPIDIAPGILTRGDRTIVTWQQNPSGRFPKAMMGYWDRRDLPVTPADSVQLDTLSAPAITGVRWIEGVATRWSLPQPLHNASAFASGEGRLDNYLAPDNLIASHASLWRTVFIAGEGGWRQYRIDSSILRAPKLPVSHTMLSSYPDRGTTVGVSLTGANTNSPTGAGIHTFFELDADGREIWRMDAPLPESAYLKMPVPVGERSVFVVSDQRGFLIRDGAVVDSTTFFARYANARYQRLLGDRFLRVIGIDSVDYRLELYTTSGRLVRAEQHWLPVAANGVFITQRHTDSLIALVWSGREGVHAVLFDPDTLKAVTEDLKVSAFSGTLYEPAAIFRGDTLLAVWRNDTDIYGNALVMPGRTSGVLAGERSNGRGMPLRGVIPNPARGEARLLLELPEPAMVIAELFDAMGEVVRSQQGRILPAGESTLELDLEGLPAGVYSVVADAGRIGRSVRHLVVIP